ncbi:phospholipid carrier-dependent glycosyltransferase [Candidatus Peregrinibacteria bacterium]|nr:phospholipid carrier-dependent glycosyltransferase [Candidatus Peregrinibacteria bacterium]
MLLLMPRFSGVPLWLKQPKVYLGIIATVFAFFTFVWNYTNPPYLYWDENYHVASAQKYLNNVYFMEPHPPLGKLLIAAGEKIFNANEVDDSFIGTDYAKELPADFSFKGYRFFPVMFAWFLAPLFYITFLYITRKPLWAFFLSFLYIFDNALITHSRAVMLDSTMLFFCMAMAVLYFVLLDKKESRNAFPLCSLLFGICFAAAITTKALSLIMVLLIPLVIVHLRKDATGPFTLKLKNFDWHKITQFVVLSASGFLIMYIAVWQAHFMIGTRVIDSLPDNGYYQASEEYQALLSNGQINFPLMLKENLGFLAHYSKGVPKLNLCKADENGSPFFYWPLGARSINYRWETPDSHSYLYITLQSNPVVWGLALVSIFLAIVLLLGSWFIPGAKKLTYNNEIRIWLGFWVAYMLAVSQIDRVMYLYHYFIPLLFSFILFGYVFMELKQMGALKLTEKRKNWMILVIGGLIFASFHFFRPLTYYEPINDDEFKRRMLFPLWELECVNCENQSLLADPLPMNQKKK